MNGKWNNLSKQKREDYKNQSEEMGFKEVEKRVKIIIDKFEEQNKLKKMKSVKSIQETNIYLTSAFEAKDWNETVFIFAHVNYLTKVKDNFYPAEVGLLKFSIDDGIIDTINFHLNSGKLPIGYENAARQRAEDTHQLPINTNFGISTSSAKQKIMDFLNTDDVNYIFTLNEGDDIRAVKDMFEITDIDEVFVGPLENLMCKYFVYFQNKKLSAQEAQEILSVKNPWLHDNLGCEYHSELDIPMHCSLAK